MWPTEEPIDELGWWVPCQNSHGQNRTLTVLVMGDRVAVVLPPGDTLIFNAADAYVFAAALERVVATSSAAP